MKKVLILFGIISIWVMGINKALASDTLTKKSIVSKNNENVLLKLPQGFKALVFADNLGRARHIAINSNGDVYIKLEKLKDGKGIYRIHQAMGSAKVGPMT